MWAMGVLDFGLADEVFWGLDLRLFRCLAERKADIEYRTDLRFGEVVAIIANVNRDTKKRPKGYRAADFFPDPRQAVQMIDKGRVRAQHRALRAGLEDMARSGRLATE